MLMHVDQLHDTMDTFCERIRTKFELKDATISRLLLCPTGEIIDDIALIEKNDKIEVELGPSQMRYFPFEPKTEEIYPGDLLRSTPSQFQPILAFQVPKFVPNARYDGEYQYQSEFRPSFQV